MMVQVDALAPAAGSGVAEPAAAHIEIATDLGPDSACGLESYYIADSCDGAVDAVVAAAEVVAVAVAAVGVFVVAAAAEAEGMMYCNAH